MRIVTSFLLFMALMMTYTLHFVEAAVPSLWLPVLSLPLAAGAFWLFARHKNAVDNVNTKLLLSVVAALLFVLGSLYNLTLANTQPVGDQWYVVKIADALSDGTFQAQGNEWMVYYLRKYPFQWGLCLFFRAVFQLFGPDAIGLLRVFNTALAVVGLVALVGICEQLWHNRHRTNLCVVAAALCLPFLLRSNFVYGSVPSESLSMVALFLMLHALKGFDAGMSPTHPRQLLCLAGMCALLFAATWLKPNALLCGAVVALVWVLWALKRKSLLPILLALLAVMAAWGGNQTPQLIARAQYGAETGQGMPGVVHVAMALQNNGAVGAGWWNAYNDEVYDRNGGNAEAAAAEAAQSLRASLGDFVASPLTALDFFGRKVTSQWCEPTHQSILIAFHEAQEPDRSERARWLPREAYALWCDVLQTLLYLGACVWAWSRERLGAQQALLIVFFLAGFAFHVVWEAKSLYVLPYALMLVPFAVAGLDMLAQALPKRLKLGRVPAH